MEAQFTGLPAELRAGAAPVEFSVVLTDRTGKPTPSVAPTLLLSGNGVTSTLSRLDPTSGAWVSDSATDGGGAPIGIDPNAASYTIPAGGALTIRYRISVSAATKPQQSRAFVYAVGATGGQLATAAQTVALTAG